MYVLDTTRNLLIWIYSFAIDIILVEVLSETVYTYFFWTFLVKFIPFLIFFQISIAERILKTHKNLIKKNSKSLRQLSTQ